MLNLNGENIPFLIEGQVLLEVILMRHATSLLPDSIQNDWREDLHDLTCMDSVKQRQKTVRRMFRYYRFLH